MPSSADLWRKFWHAEKSWPTLVHLYLQLNVCSEAEGAATLRMIDMLMQHVYAACAVISAPLLLRSAPSFAYRHNMQISAAISRCVCRTLASVSGWQLDEPEKYLASCEYAADVDKMCVSINLCMCHIG